MTKWPASERLRAWPWTSLTGASATFAASASRGLHELWRRTAPPSHRGSPPPRRSGRPEAFLRVSLDNHRRRLALRRGSSDGDGSGAIEDGALCCRRPPARCHGDYVGHAGFPATQLHPTAPTPWQNRPSSTRGLLVARACWREPGPTKSPSASASLTNIGRPTARRYPLHPTDGRSRRSAHAACPTATWQKPAVAPLSGAASPSERPSNSGSGFACGEGGNRFVWPTLWRT